ncbi:hypothetical protein PQG02_02935 [Nostoc sp. UHCC 0926]|uniref:hypothetical protein n=1 Tax=unclassified Nostoc TaxID=2593658 RepID=UPI002360623E|nr:hypothetical protein [Nostoc sp. UHCC 0926]WDD33367.1 hypothetical protein PQG02_02935 [Nostoc sp. UHCC 0926]
MQRILSNFGKKNQIFTAIAYSKGNKGDHRDKDDKVKFFLPAPFWKYAYLSIDVNNNDKYMQLDERVIIQQTINLRLLVGKNTKPCNGKSACYYY